jgi:hypothetical protein
LFAVQRKRDAKNKRKPIDPGFDSKKTQNAKFFWKGGSSVTVCEKKPPNFDKKRPKMCLTKEELLTPRNY